MAAGPGRYDSLRTAAALAWSQPPVSLSASATTWAVDTDGAANFTRDIGAAPAKTLFGHVIGAHRVGDCGPPYQGYGSVRCRLRRLRVRDPSRSVAGHCRPRTRAPRPAYRRHPPRLSPDEVGGPRQISITRLARAEGERTTKDFLQAGELPGAVARSMDAPMNLTLRRSTMIREQPSAMADASVRYRASSAASVRPRRGTVGVDTFRQDARD